jgi:hypothetical protein
MSRRLTVEDLEDDLEFDFEDEDTDDEYERPEADYEAYVEERAMAEWDDDERGDWALRDRGDW